MAEDRPTFSFTAIHNELPMRFVKDNNLMLAENSIAFPGAVLHENSDLMRQVPTTLSQLLLTEATARTPTRRATSWPVWRASRTA